MLLLDDPRWRELTHAYGSAADVPALLRQLAESPDQRGPNEEPWFNLWSSLCHQGDVYGASYAAIPHVVRIALSTPRPIDFSFFLLPASVDVARITGRGPEIPAFLVPSYLEAIKLLPECVSVHRAYAWSKDMTISTAAALAVAKGHHLLAEALTNLDDDWISKINNHEWG
jgi:hypothetical protein